MTVTRRAFLALTAAAATHVLPRPVAALGLDEPPPALPGPGPYGDLQPPDANGIALPAGFSSRVVATTGNVVSGPSGYTWHDNPDGGAVFVQPDGGWVYVSNEENNAGGVGALRFAADGTVVDGYRVLDGTRRNCAGGPTPWGTWLSCEETSGGLVYECRVDRPGNGAVRPALGSFFHEAAAVDPVHRVVILTEDQPDSRLYRFRPDTWSKSGDGVLESGVLEAASVAGFDGPGPWPVTWVEVAADRPARSAGTTAFKGGEGAWAADGHVYFTTKGDGRVWDLDVAADVLELLYDDDLARQAAGRAPLTGVDNVTVSPGGEVFVAEDGGNMELVVIGDRDERLEVASFLRIEGHSRSEVAGPAFHPDGRRLYVSSQRGPDGGPDGMTFEITGPFTISSTPPPATTSTSSTTTSSSTSTSTTEAAEPPSTSDAVPTSRTGDTVTPATAEAANAETSPRGEVSDSSTSAPTVVAAAGIAAAGAAAIALRRRLGVAPPADPPEDPDPESP